VLKGKSAGCECQAARRAPATEVPEHVRATKKPFDQFEGLFAVSIGGFTTSGVRPSIGR
jgi:hypothetical protein